MKHRSKRLVEPDHSREALKAAFDVVRKNFWCGTDTGGTIEIDPCPHCGQPIMTVHENENNQKKNPA